LVGVVGVDDGDSGDDEKSVGVVDEIVNGLWETGRVSLEAGRRMRGCGGTRTGSLDLAKRQPRAGIPLLALIVTVPSSSTL
jgi:hypothetical protein